MKYIAVGITTDDDKNKENMVTVCIGDFGVFHLNEEGARKLADDVLRNANHLWPIKQEHP